VKAVNLMPPEGRASRLGTSAGVKLVVAPPRALGAYGVLAALVVAVLMAGAWASSNRQLSNGRADLARNEAAAQAAEAKVAAFKPYTAFAKLSRTRVETLDGLIKGRFDWSHGLREVARVVPDDVDLVSLVGTTSPSARVEGAGSGGALRAALPVPAIDVVGCTRTQADVARLLARLRSIDGVQRVSLASAEKSDSASVSDTDCRRTSAMPQFQITVFFQAQDGIVTAAAAAPAAATTATGGTTK
jgi:Tfp pilus assembly protein PilN